MCAKTIYLNALGMMKVRIAKKSATIFLDTVNDQTAVESSRRLEIRLVPLRLKKEKRRQPERIRVFEHLQKSLGAYVITLIF
jgi:hypothetical protein